MHYLGHPQAALEAAGGIWTAREIVQQPAVWAEIERGMRREAAALAAFLDPLLARRDLRIVLTGAGTSAFVGECLAPVLKRRTRLREQQRLADRSLPRPEARPDKRDRRRLMRLQRDQG